MKKLLIMMVMVMGAVVVNAQRSPVKLPDLPKGVTDNIAKDYPGYTIKETTKVIDHGVTTYEIVVVKGMTQLTLTFDSNGKFLKKNDAKSGMVIAIPKSSPRSSASS
jgi:hypothetical protein